MRGIGEKFTANPLTGTGALTVPIATSPARSGFGPELALSYDSGSGNGPFGLGWSLSVPRISRKTDKGLPQYFDGAESDVFLLSGAEDLVPVLSGAGEPQDDADSNPGFVVHRYRPRVEGLFARIERWTDVATGDVHWRSITRTNVTNLYGRENASRIFDPAEAGSLHPRRIFEWLLCESYDDKGNAIRYEYAAENDVRVNRIQASEQNRQRAANRYLKRVKYGNRVSRLLQPDLGAAEWLFEVVFDYDEDQYSELPPDPGIPAEQQHRLVRVSAESSGDWRVRPDRFSTYRAGFEVRAYRRCVRVLMFHRFAELGSEPCLVRATEFDYADLDLGSAVSVDGERGHQGSTRYASFMRRIVQSGYTRVHGVPVEAEGSLRYVRYLKRALPALELEYSKPTIQEQVLELDADNALGLPVGVDAAENDPNTPFVDLTGDGQADALITDEQLFTWYPSLEEQAFGAAPQVRKVRNEEKRPRLVFADRTESVYLADMTGDGLADLVRIRNGQVCYWPNLGYGRLGAKITMDNAPWFERGDDFDHARVRLADIDGSGTVDILYLHSDGPRLYFNQCGNGWSEARPLQGLPAVNSLASVTTADLLGNGTACLVWSSPLAADATRPLRFVDLMGGKKPHLLVRSINNLGAETHVHVVDPVLPR